MKFCVIGLGRFGYHLATTLADNGMEVLAIDRNKTIVSSIRNNVTQAVCLSITDEESLRSVGVEEMDTVIVATGEDFAQAILITALLKNRLQTPQIITRAVNEIHKEILQLIGADRIVLPEQEIGIKVADSLSSPFMSLMRLSSDFSISQIVAPAKFVGKSITELDLFDKYNCNCIGIKRDTQTVDPIGQHYIISPHDKLIFSGHNDDLEKIAKL